MIFQALISLYDRLKEKDAVPDFGFSLEDIGFVIRINQQGDIVDGPIDLRTPAGANRYEFRESVVPYANKVNVRSSGASKTPNFMVDKPEYIFGMSNKTKKPVHNKSFKELMNAVCAQSQDSGVKAVMAFLGKWSPDESPELSFWDEMCGTHGKWTAFQLEGDREFIHERPAVRELWKAYIQKEEYAEGYNFIDGRRTKLQSQFAQFKFGSGASMVSFNEKAYESYQKKRGDNAPISLVGEFKSSTALKYLLRNGKHRLRIGDAVTVFWTERDSPVEEFMGVVLNPDDSSEESYKLKAFLDAARKGKQPQIPDYDESDRFYILGLSVNKARLAVRFWHNCSVDELKNRLGLHFNALEMERSRDGDPLNPGIWHLLKETARESKDIQPLLGGALVRSILEGVAYPMNLFNGVLNRFRADQRINYLRAAICKAVLTRNFRREVSVSLDTENKDIAYLLGRLFAVLEKAQMDAVPGANATIKDRFYSAASATPAGVFPRLLRLTQHHIAKSEYGRISDRRISDIMEDINGFPSHMDLKAQGIFAIGYYQQRNALYRKQETITQGEENE